MSGCSVKPHNCPHSSAHQPLTQTRIPACRRPGIVSYSITRSIRGTQIPIVRDQPPSSRFPRFPPLEVFRRRPPMRAAPSVSSRHPKTFTIATECTAANNCHSIASSLHRSASKWLQRRPVAFRATLQRPRSETDCKTDRMPRVGTEDEPTRAALIMTTMPVTCAVLVETFANDRLGRGYLKRAIPVAARGP
jgi:hypothetical protein